MAFYANKFTVQISDFAALAQLMVNMIPKETPREGEKRKCSKCSKDPTLPEPCNNADCPYVYS